MRLGVRFEARRFCNFACFTHVIKANYVASSFTIILSRL